MSWLLIHLHYNILTGVRTISTTLMIKNHESVIDYIFVLDALNFCFWQSDWEYDTLATSLKNILINDPNAFKPENLLKLDFATFKATVFLGVEFPLIKERLRLIHELANSCIKYHKGEFSNIVKSANNSTEELVETIARTFLGFQDHAIYEGEQVFFYKRAQILVGDIWGAFRGEGLGFFKDTNCLTMFADYRVPQILVHLGIMEYSQELKDLINDKTVLEHGGKHEVEIRAGTVVAVEILRELLNQKGVKYSSIEIDWLLWQKGEAIKDQIFPHHRTLSIFY